MTKNLSSTLSNLFNQIRCYSTAKEKRVYKTSDSGSITSFTRSLDDPANDFSVIQTLGMDPKHVGIHNMIVRDNQPISWSYGTWDYYDAGDVKKITHKTMREFMKNCINKEGVTYGVIPVIVDPTQRMNAEYISVTGQLILTNLIDPREYYNNFELGIKQLGKRYGKKNVIGVVVFKYRPISYDKSVHDRISNIPNYKIVREHIPLKSFDISLEEFDLIPSSINLEQYGKIINNEFIYNGVKQSGTHYLYKKETGVIIFVHDSNIKNQRKLTVFKNTVMKFSCIDTFDKNNDVFTREIIGANEGFKLFINNSTNKILYSETPVKCESIKKGKIDPVKDDKISSFDIETYVDSNKVFIPYACAFARYDNYVQTYYLTDFKNQRDMFKNCVLDMLSSDLGTVYVHNLTKFDSYFLNDVLKNDEEILSNYKMNKDGKILSINVRFKAKNKKGEFIFRDSLLLLPNELRILTKKFGAINEKLYFPHRFVQEDNLNYIGSKPEFEYYDYDADNQKDYDEIKSYYDCIKSNDWNLKEELLKYLENDVKGLQQVVKKFSDDIWKLEHLNVTKTPTCSSLAFKAIKTNYLDKDVLYQVKGAAHNNMREAYFGGISEVYNLKAEKGVRIYDINSSYPASMKQVMPVGKPIFSTDPGGLDNYFGVVYAKIETPKSSKNIYEKLDYPPLPFRIPEGSIINPIGKWTGWYSSEILKYVRDVWGYKINVNYGYKFSKGEAIFNEFVDKYYNIKAGLSKDLDINRDTSKLMLNSGYGRMGMKLDDVETKFLSTEESREIQKKYQVLDVIQFSPEIEWIKYRRQLNDSFIWTTITEGSDKTDLQKLSASVLRVKENDSMYDVEQSLPVAIFTAAYSTIRLFEGIRKIQKSGKVVYAVDTDSIHTDGYLPEDCIGKDLGQWKLEYDSDGRVGLYPLPKVYFVEGKDGGKDIKDVKKGKGVKRKSITKDEYIKLTQGESIEKEEMRFKIIKKDFLIKLEKVKINLSAELNKRIPSKKRTSTKPLLVLNGVIQHTINNSNIDG